MRINAKSKSQADKRPKIRKGRKLSSEEARRIVGMRTTFTELSTKQARRMAAQRKTFGGGPGRSRTVKRCQCGAMSIKRARQRNHRCESRLPTTPIP